MLDFYMHEFADIAWDEFCLSDDHIVPDSGTKRVDDHFILGDNHKKRPHELASNSSNNGDRSAAKYVDQGGFSPLSKRRNTMLEKDSWSQEQDSAFTRAFDCDLVKEASSLASDSTMPSTHGLKSNDRNSSSSEFCGLDNILDDKTSIVDSNSFNYPAGDVNHTSNDVNYFDNAENKNSSDLLYCDWPEIENFEDIDRMFRSCDSTFGVGVCKEDELDWLSSDVGGSGDVRKSDVKFPCLGPSEMENISEDHEFSNGYSVNDSSMTSEPISFKDSSWTSEKSDSRRSFVIGRDIADNKDRIAEEKGPGLYKIQPRMSTSSHFGTGRPAVTNEHEEQIKLQTQSEGKSKENYLGNGSFDHISHLSNEVSELSSGLTSDQAFRSVPMQQQHVLGPDSYGYLQNSISYLRTDNSHMSDPSSVDLKPCIVKSETNDFTSLSPRDSSHASSQLQYMEGSPGSAFDATAQRKKLRCCKDSLSSVHDSLKNGSLTVQASISDPGLVGKYENHFDAEGVSLATPAELGSSNIQESSSTGSDLDDISLEAASFRQLQLVMEQLDLRTKLSIRDSLYRLARSAERRHHHANLTAGGEGDAASGAPITEGSKRYTGFMDMETDTNPIDRSVAHLLFHRPSDSSTTPAQESSLFKSSRGVHGSVTSPPVLADSLVNEQNGPKIEKVSDC